MKLRHISVELTIKAEFLTDIPDTNPSEAGNMEVSRQVLYKAQLADYSQVLPVGAHITSITTTIQK